MRFQFGQFITVAGLLCLATATSAQQSAAPRGNSAHDAASHYSASRNAQGCRVDHLSNSRFILVPNADPNTVLLETISTARCITAEGGWGEIQVTAWPLDAPSDAQPLFQIRTPGESGKADGGFYEAVEEGCCGTNDLKRYFSLRNGRELFASSGTVLRIAIGGSAKRFIAVHDTYSASYPNEADHDTSVVAVFQYGDSVSPSKRWVLMGSVPRGWQVDSLYFVRDGRRSDSTEVSFTRPHALRNLPIVVENISVVLVLAAWDGLSGSLRAEFPLGNDGPIIAQSKLSPGLRLVSK